MDGEGLVCLRYSYIVHGDTLKDYHKIKRFSIRRYHSCGLLPLTDVSGLLHCYAIHAILKHRKYIALGDIHGIQNIFRLYN